MASDKRQDRAWIKVQLKDDFQSWQASDIVARWKNERIATMKMTRAIIVYDALQSGDLSPLLQDFPMLRALLSNAPAIPTADLPAPSGKPIKTRPAKEKTQAEDVGDFLEGLGLG